ncbi:MAG: GNAT family N-acetyltransferase, partial [Candidatus Sericytochromatia bacterium]
GHGFELWKQANASLGQRTVGMDGVVAQQENYKKSGYRYAYRQMRFQGAGGAPANASAPLVDLRDFALEQLAAYDRRHFPAERPEFLKLWISRPGTVALGYMEGESLAGYGVLRPCRQGYKIGPLFADTPEIAESLYNNLCASVSQQDPVFLDVPEPNPHAMALVERHQMKYVFETARMYTGTPPELPLEQIYGITSFELG